jgi:RimJ/RimL family protein N-acetyltransferase
MDLRDAVTRLPSDERVALRPWRSGDAPTVARVCADPDIQRWTLVPEGYTEAHAEEFIAYATEALAAGTSAELAVVAAADADVVLGAAGLVRIDWDHEQAEVGYWTAAEGRGRGVATRAVRLLTAWAFRELPLARLQLMPFIGNEASERVAERAGYRREGVLRSFHVSKNGLADVVMFARLRADADDAEPAARA